MILNCSNSVPPRVSGCPLKGGNSISPGQRPGECCSWGLRPERAKAIIKLWATMLLPLQGAIRTAWNPRALPWAGCWLAFQAVASQKVYGTTLLFYSTDRCKSLTPITQILLSKCLDFTPHTVVRKTKPIVVKIISNLKKIISKII